MRHAFILNPAAGKRDETNKLEREIREAFCGTGEQFFIERTLCAGHAEQLARKYAADKVETVLYACGGDGTLSEAAQALPGNPQLIFAPVPVGTGNDFVKNLANMAKRPAIKDMLGCKSEPFDLLLAGNRVALNMVSLGFDAAVAQKAQSIKRLPLVGGDAAYNMALAISFFSCKSCRCSFVADGEKIPVQEYIIVLMANGRCYGGGYNCAPAASISDGMLEFIRIAQIPRIKLLPIIKDFKSGKYLDRYDYVRQQRCSEIKVEADCPLALNCDGEVRTVINPVIKVIPNAARILRLDR